MVRIGVVKREGKWRLEKDKEGVYLITKREEVRAKIITDDYSPKSPLSDERGSMMTETIEVKNFKKAKKTFKNYIERQESGGLF